MSEEREALARVIRGLTDGPLFRFARTPGDQAEMERAIAAACAGWRRSPQPAAGDEAARELYMADQAAALRAAEQRERALREALAEYGKHKLWCLISAPKRPVCTCGLTAALEASR